MAQIDPIPNTARFERIAEPRQSTVAAIVRATDHRGGRVALVGHAPDHHRMTAVRRRLDRRSPGNSADEPPQISAEILGTTVGNRR